MSTGPRTDVGRAQSAKNATTHGFASQEVVLPSEDAEAFEHLLQAYLVSYAPQNEQEKFFVCRMAEAAWRLRRVRKFEVGILADNPDPLDKLTKLSRYESAIERSYYRAYREIVAMYKRRSDSRRAAMNAYVMGPMPPSEPRIPKAEPAPPSTQTTKNAHNPRPTAAPTERTQSQNRTPDPDPYGLESIRSSDPRITASLKRIAENLRRNAAEGIAV
jgi:hypothetical protein